MRSNLSLRVPGAALLIVTAAFLVLAPGAWAGGSYRTLYRFEPKDGDFPVGALISDAAGNLYGTASEGGKGAYCAYYGCGTVFKLTPNRRGGWTESLLYTFCSLSNCSDGGFPAGSLIFDQAGNLYGATGQGGIAGGGTVFKLTPSRDGSWYESVLYSFCSLKSCSDGLSPNDGLIFDKAGNLYGTTQSGGRGEPIGAGTAFRLAPTRDGSWSESVLYRFCAFQNCSDGKGPSSGLIFDQTGNLYGTTVQGGAAEGVGTVFELTPNRDGSWTESVLYRFCSLTNCEDGAQPSADLIFDQAGNLDGTTNDGGSAGAGTVFELTPNRDGSWSESVLYSFCSLTNCSDGGDYPPSVILDQAGNLYGTTYYGGNAGYGVVFKLAPTARGGGWNETVLHNFLDRPGALPQGGMIFDAAGNLYGTTGGDHYKTYGSVFKIAP